MKNKRFTLVIENISEGKEIGYCIRLPDLHDSIVLGENYEELAKGIEMTFEAEHKQCAPELLTSLRTYLQRVKHKVRSSKELEISV